MKMLRRVVLVILVLVFVLLFLPALPTPLGLLLTRVPFAWINYLERTLPNVTANWSGIGMVLLCSGLAIAIGHSFCRWLYQQMAAGTKSDLPGIWPMRWTLALYGGFCVLFVIVMAASGLARTTTWLFQFNQPFYRARPSYWVDMWTIDSLIANATLEEKSDIKQMRARILENDQSRWEQYNILLFPGPSNALNAALYYPRDPEGQRRVGFRVLGESQEYKIDQLPEVISRLEKASKEGTKKL